MNYSVFFWKPFRNLLTLSIESGSIKWKFKPKFVQVLMWKIKRTLRIKRRKCLSNLRCQLSSVRKYPLHFYNKQSPDKVPKNVDYTRFFSPHSLSISLCLFLILSLFSRLSTFPRCILNPCPREAISFG